LNIIKRSLINLVRSPGRTAVVTVLLAISLGLGLTMFEVYDVASNQLRAISGEIGTDIFVSVAGYEGPTGGNLILAQADIAKLKDLAHVISAQPSLEVAYSGNTSIKTASPVYPETGRVKVQPVQSLSLMGLDPAIANPILRLRGGNVKMATVAGTYFTVENIDANVMVIGQALAEANSFQVGSTIDVKGTPVKVIGIYSTGQTDNRMIMPITTVQRLYNLQGANGVAVVADDVNNVDDVVHEISAALGANNADIFTATSDYFRINPDIINASNASQMGMIVTFIVAAAVILLAVFLVVRQRVREIGVLKAIGASNWRIGLVFGLETLIVSLVAAFAGVGLTFIFARKITPGDIAAIISPETFLVATVVAVTLALVASVIPVWYIGRVKPAEVLRNE
jgi:putative ABC transport system permease protein